jgi:uncharacterized protein with von Willebrand factor type A (vWA) domain
MTAAASGAPGAIAGGLLRARLARFLRQLRLNGFVIGLTETADALRLLAGDSLGQPARLQAELKALLAGRKADWQRFDELFAAHWLAPGRRRQRLVAGRPPGRLPAWPPPAGPPGAAGPGAMPHGRANGEPAAAGQGRGLASPADRLAETDLRHLADPEALAQVHALAARLAARLRYRLARRMQSRRHGRRLDLRRTIRKSIGRGGTPLDLVRRHRREPPLRLVVLLDVSGSMSPYSTFFLRFLHAVVDRCHQAEAYVFHTRLVEIGPALREPDPARAVERLTLLAQGWAGGTRIGDSLASFERQHAARVLQRRSVLMIVSDGYDTGPPERLAAALAALKRRARRLVWLNPMLGWPSYAPVAGGMATALPHLDLFAPAHNLASLAALEHDLARL